MEGHQLLEDASPSYSNATVRRAFIVWMHCGQKNSFKDVCNYYHHLEGLEDKLPPDYRTKSRYHEFNMFSNPPPSTSYLQETFPDLYTQRVSIQQYMMKVDTLNTSLFQKDNSDLLTKLELTEQKHKGSKQEILETSHMIKQYCKTYMKPIQKFLDEFNRYAKKCELNCNVNNVVSYIKRKMVQEELLMEANYSRALSFLNLSEDRPVDMPKIKILSRDKTRDSLNLYWKGLTSFNEISVRNSVTRT